jgi:NAD-dependent deacetylase
MVTIFAEIEAGGSVPPLCADCQWPIKPDTVLFDEMLPAGIWLAAQKAVEQCDLLLVLGSSLVVYPAAELPMYALKNKAQLIIVNLEPTDYDSQSTLTIHCGLGEFAEAIFAESILPQL